MKDEHEVNRRYWDASSHEWAEQSDNDWRRIQQEPSLAFDGSAWEFINQFTGGLKNKRVCVIGSGDNYASLALASSGAKVTSTDISENQLEVARKRANALGLNIEFFRRDASDLADLPDSGFDLVCSTNGFFVWIADLGTVYSEVSRILKPGGYYIFYDVHPFMRPWKDQTTIKIEKPYFETGPFSDTDYGHPIKYFHWMLKDIVNALAESGLILRRMAENPAKYTDFWSGHSLRRGNEPGLLDWHTNPRAGLPAWLTIAAQKPG